MDCVRNLLVFLIITLVLGSCSSPSSPDAAPGAPRAGEAAVVPQKTDVVPQKTAPSSSAPPLSLGAILFNVLRLRDEAGREPPAPRRRAPPPPRPTRRRPPGSL